MIKLALTLLLACFCIYGFERLGVIEVDDFEMSDTVKEDAAVEKDEGKVQPKRFTDRIAEKNNMTEKSK